MRYKFLLFLFLVGVYIFFFLKKQYFDTPLLTYEHEFYIHKNDSFTDIKFEIDSLSKDLPLSAKIFLNFFLRKKRLEYWVRPGRYILKESSSLNDVIDKLRSQAQDPVNFTFNSMDDVTNVFTIVSNSLELDSITLIQYLGSRQLDLDSLYFLFIPNTYEMFWNISAEEFLDRMYVEYDNFWNKSRINAANKINLSKDEVFVLASIVDKEASHVEEMPRIAGLYLNRLAKNWFLAADPTIVYSYKQLFDKSIRRIRNKHIDITRSSLFNTYHHKGLPPLPICVPSFQALEAVLNAEKHQYMYMCARPDESEYHNFSKNYFQHKKNANAFHKWLNSRKIF